MSVGEPLRAGIVEVGERASLEFLRRRFVARDGAFRITQHRLVHPPHPFGTVFNSLYPACRGCGNRSPLFDPPSLCPSNLAYSA